MKINTLLADLPEQELLRRFGDLVRQDRHNTAQLLAHIAEIDERKLWAKHACSSMFAFCMERFYMSESMTAKRIWAARTARRFPVILPMVARGELHLSAINQLGKHLTEDNYEALLALAKHKSSREIDVLVAELAPRADVPSRVRALPRLTRGVAPVEAPQASAREARGSNERGVPNRVPNRVPNCAAAAASKAACDAFEPAAAAAKPAANHRQVVALAPRRFKIEITVDQQTHDRLRSLQDLLSHQLPSADPAMIVSRAIALLLDDTLKKKAAVTKASVPQRRSTGRRDPAASRSPSEHAPFRPRSGAKYGRATSVVARSSINRDGAAEQRAVLSTITRSPTAKAAVTRWRISRCVAGPTISTRQIWITDELSCWASVTARVDIPRGMFDGRPMDDARLFVRSAICSRGRASRCMCWRSTEISCGIFAVTPFIPRPLM